MCGANLTGGVPARFVPRGLTCKFRTRGKLCTRRRKSLPRVNFSYMLHFVYMRSKVYLLILTAGIVKCQT
jgi:hypothetical protein